MLIDLTVTTEPLAAAMSSDGLACFNAGCYPNMPFQVRLRQLTGSEHVRVIGTSAGARLTNGVSFDDVYAYVSGTRVRSRN